ncbi:MAG: mannose-6-phosphate isomerase, partial [Clostridia bacterium]|nr:mannose-6-phosphate isomerase [Clostridia bacterium]
NSIEVIPGDVIYIPAKFVHAIGAGCLLLEIQEPTDFTIQPERYCGTHRLRDEEMYMGIDPDEALDCFDFAKSVNAPLSPETVEYNDGLLYQNLIGPGITGTFNVRMINLSGGEFILDKPAAIYVAVDGEGALKGDGYERKLKRGDYFFLPAAAVDKFKITGNIKVVECYE